MPPQKKHHGHHLAHPAHHGDANGNAKKPSMKVDIPKHDPNVSETEALRTPKTPQNEGLSWFESYTGTEPLQVYELALEADGGPNKDRAVSCIRQPETAFFGDQFLTDSSLFM
jgi:glycogen debranching enzyme